MSDHEGGDIGDWEDASLPGGADFSFRGTDSIIHDVLPRNLATSFEDMPGDPALDIIRARRYSRTSRTSRADQAPPRGYRSEIQAIHGLVRRSSGIQGRKSREHENHENRESLEGAAYQSYQKNEEPTSSFGMSVTWKVLQSNMNIRGESGTTPERFARRQLDEICRKTGTYISTPDPESPDLFIWGQPEHVELAKRELGAWVDHTRDARVRRSQNKWHKEKAFDGRTADRLDLKLRDQEKASAFRSMEESLDYAFELYYQWPDQPRMAEFIDKYDKTYLEGIRSQILCKIEFFEGAPAYYKVSAQTEDNVKAISLRINNLILAMEKQNGEFIRCIAFKLPPAPQYRNRVGLERVASNVGVVPRLYGEPLEAGETEDWEKLCTTIQVKTRVGLRNAMSKCLSSLYAPTKHVRMRVTFAQLAFVKYQKPPEDRDYHTINEFCAMISHQNTRLRPLGLRAEHGSMADLADALSAMPEFGPSKTCYTLHFDFNSRNDSTLRLEVEYDIGIMTGEPEITATRWLEFSSDVNEYEMLEASMIDLAHLKCNYQINIGGTELFEPENTKSRVGKQMFSFKDKIRFYPPADGIKAPLKRRTVYPSGNVDLQVVEEITIMRFPFKDTGGVFELQRKDIYNEKGGAASAPISSVWAGKYYYHEWDTMMDEFANLQPGEPVSWPLDMRSFIPDRKGAGSWSDGGTRHLPKGGFRTWLKEIEEVQALLAKAIEQVEAGEAEVQ